MRWFLVLLTMSNTAVADWQYTRWGMSLDQLKSAIEASGSSLSDPETPNKYDEKGRYTLVYSEYKGANINFKSSFSFDYSKSKLVAVKLAPLGQGRRQCKEVEAMLGASYGDPIALSDGDLQWRDQANGNLVRLTRLTDSICSVDYEPLPVGGSKGGL